MAAGQSRPATPDQGAVTPSWSGAVSRSPQAPSSAARDTPSFRRARARPFGRDHHVTAPDVTALLAPEGTPSKSLRPFPPGAARGRIAGASGPSERLLSRSCARCVGALPGASGTAHALGGPAERRRGHLLFPGAPGRLGGRTRPGAGE